MAVLITMSKNAAIFQHAAAGDLSGRADVAGLCVHATSQLTQQVCAATAPGIMALALQHNNQQLQVGSCCLCCCLQSSFDCLSAIDAMFCCVPFVSNGDFAHRMHRNCHKAVSLLHLVWRTVQPQAHS
jgi:hypothetical protein